MFLAHQPMWQPYTRLTFVSTSRPEEFNRALTKALNLKSLDEQGSMAGRLDEQGGAVRQMRWKTGCTPQNWHGNPKKSANVWNIILLWFSFLGSIPYIPHIILVFGDFPPGWNGSSGMQVTSSLEAMLRPEMDIGQMLNMSMATQALRCWNLKIQRLMRNIGWFEPVDTSTILTSTCAHQFHFFLMAAFLSQMGPTHRYTMQLWPGCQGSTQQSAKPGTQAGMYHGKSCPFPFCARVCKRMWREFGFRKAQTEKSI